MAIANPQYLLVTNQKDITSDFLVRELQRRGLSFYRLNTENLPQFQIRMSSKDEGMFLCSERVSINSELIKSAYFRRPGMIEIHDEVSSDATIYRRTEWTYMLRSFYLELGSKWFSHPNNILLAENKPGQLRLANEIGFNVPEYIISNSSENLDKLFNEGPVVAKPLSHNLLDSSDVERVIFTVNANDYKEIEGRSLAQAPVIFQRRIEKAFDLRVTVVGSIVFAVRIYSQVRDETKTDWRAGGDKLLRHALVELPDVIKNMCVRFTKRMNIRYGAIDLVEDKSGCYWFLECNPNGQWAWIENVTGAPISKAIVDTLIEQGGADALLPTR